MSPNRFLPCALLSLLAACGQPPAGQQDLDGLDRELTAGVVGGQQDPALIAALRDQIMIDPALAQSANTNVVRPPARPDPLSIPPDPLGPPRDTVRAADLKQTPAARGDCPACRRIAEALTLEEMAARATPSDPSCAAHVTYSAIWSTRLPADRPLYPDARVREAAGNDACGLRIVGFASDAPPSRILDWYNARVTGAGYSVRHQAAGADHMLDGSRGGAAYLVHVVATPGGGSMVDLLVR